MVSGLRYLQLFIARAFGARDHFVDLLAGGSRKNNMFVSLHDWEHI